MSVFDRLLKRLGSRREPRHPIAGRWAVEDISGPHPFASFLLDLRPDGALAWQANVPTTDSGDFDVTGSGTWRADGTTLHYVSGESAGTCPYQLEDGKLVLGGLPATQLDRSLRCVLARVDEEDG